MSTLFTTSSTAFITSGSIHARSCVQQGWLNQACPEGCTRGRKKAAPQFTDREGSIKSKLSSLRTNSSHLSKVQGSLGGRLLLKASGRELPLHLTYHSRLCIWHRGWRTQPLGVTFMAEFVESLAMGYQISQCKMDRIVQHYTLPLRTSHLKILCSQLQRKKWKSHWSLLQMGTLVDKSSSEMLKESTIEVLQRKASSGSSRLRRNVPYTFIKCRST